MQRNQQGQYEIVLDLNKEVFSSEEAFVWTQFILAYGKREADETLSIEIEKDKSYSLSTINAGKDCPITVTFAQTAKIAMPARTAPTPTPAYRDDAPARNTISIDPRNLTPETEAVLRAALAKAEGKILGGEVLEYQADTDTDYVLSEGYNFYRMKKQGYHALCSGELGKGSSGRVEKLIGVYQEQEGQALIFHPHAKKLRPDKKTKKKKWVAKISLLAEGQIAEVENERTVLERAGYRAKEVVTFEDEDEAGKKDQYSVLFIQRVKGISLASDLDKIALGEKPARTLQNALKLCENIAVAYKTRLPDNGLVHGDLKPANIMVNNETADIVDLGSAKEIGSRGVFGTPGYVAPELYRRGFCTTKTDIFSLGIVFGEVLGRCDGKAANEYYKHDMNLFNTCRERTGHHYYKAACEGRLEMYAIELFAGFSEKDLDIQKKIRNFISSMIDPKPEKRPTPERVCEFFHNLQEELFAREELSQAVVTESRAAEENKGRAPSLKNAPVVNEVMLPSEKPPTESVGAFIHGKGEELSQTVVAEPSAAEKNESRASSLDNSEKKEVTLPIVQVNEPVPVLTEKEFAQKLLGEVLGLDGEITKRLGYFGGKNVSVPTIILASAKENYRLPTGAARMAEELIKFLGQESKMEFADLITLCAKHAAYGYMRRPDQAMFSGQLPKVTDFYKNAISLKTRAEQESGKTLKLNQELFFKS